MSIAPVSVAVVVRDRKKALAWYTKKLGLKLLANDDHLVVVGSEARGMRLHLCAVRDYDPKGKFEKGNTGILFFTSGDILQEYRRLKARGVKFPQPPEKMAWGWYCMFQDPDGNEFWLSPKFGA